MDLLNIFAWAIIGGVAGLLVSYLIQTETAAGRVADVIIGILGGLIGGVALRALNVIGDTDLTGVVHLPSALVALVGAAILLAIVEIVRRANR